MKFITLDGLKVFLDGLLEKIGQEVYTKTESNAKYQARGQYVTGEAQFTLSAQHRPVSVDTSSIVGFQFVKPIIGYLTEEKATEVYQPKGDYATLGELSQKANTADVYTKKQTDELFAPNGSYLDKATADNTYQKKGRYVTESGVRSLLGTFGYLTKNTADGYYQPKGQYLTKYDVYSGGGELKLPNGTTIGVE